MSHPDVLGGDCEGLHSPVQWVLEWLGEAASTWVKKGEDVGNGLNRGRNGSTGHLQSSVGQIVSFP